MRIQILSTSNYQINYKANLAKKTLYTIATGLATVSTLGKHKFDSQEIDNDNFCEELYEDLSEVEEVDDNIFDEEYYQAYYNIDLNLAKNRAFRDNELFNPLRDNESIGYHFYDTDDVKTADNLIYKNKINEYTTEYKLSDTDFGDLKLPNAVKKPKVDDLRINERYEKLNRFMKELGRGDMVKQCILEFCRTGYGEVDFELVDIAMKLLKNNKHHKLGVDERIIISELKHADKENYDYCSNFINEQIDNNVSNRKILRLLSKTNYMPQEMLKDQN